MAWSGESGFPWSQAVTRKMQRKQKGVRLQSPRPCTLTPGSRAAWPSEVGKEPPIGECVDWTVPEAHVVKPRLSKCSHLETGLGSTEG